MVAFSLALSVLASGCAVSERRPSVVEWRPRWEAAQALVPPLEQVADPPDRELCTDVLVAIRATRGELLPTPDPSVDGPVQEWLEVAELVFFQCPPHTPPIEDFAAGYEEMGRLAAEVEAGLGPRGDG